MGPESWGTTFKWGVESLCCEETFTRFMEPLVIDLLEIPGFSRNSEARIVLLGKENTTRNNVWIAPFNINVPLTWQIPQKALAQWNPIFLEERDFARFSPTLQEFARLVPQLCTTCSTNLHDFALGRFGTTRPSCKPLPISIPSSCIFFLNVSPKWRALHPPPPCRTTGCSYTPVAALSVAALSAVSSVAGVLQLLHPPPPQRALSHPSQTPL